MTNDRKAKRFNIDDVIVKSDQDDDMPTDEIVETSSDGMPDPRETIEKAEPESDGTEGSVKPPVAQPLHSPKEMLEGTIKKTAEEFYKENSTKAVPHTPSANLREEIASILVPNTELDMPKALVKFTGSDENYYLLDCHPARVRKAWQTYILHDEAIPGRFMELVFDILKVGSRRYFHQVSLVELR